MDGVEQRHGLLCLVGLQRANQMQHEAWFRRNQRRPFRFFDFADAQRGESAEVEADDTGTLPDDPEKLRHRLSLGRASASLTDLQDLVERIRAREASESGARREAWTRAFKSWNEYFMKKATSGTASRLPVDVLDAWVRASMKGRSVGNGESERGDTVSAIARKPR